MQTNNQNSNSPISPKLGSSVTNAIKNAEAGELPALDDISNITNRVVDKIKASENILIALSKNPNIDEISAALGLAMILDTIHKHVTAIFSGQVPNVLQFLKPEETFEKTTNSLQDFIIALSKDKVDHISYKIEGDFVKVYVTPYKATIGQADLSMSYGDYNVDLVICFDVISGDEIDPALSEYGRIMHDATAINLTVGTPGRFAELEWQDSNVSSISEMVVGLADKLGLASFSEQIATALLTGIVASTDHFSNPRTSSNTMSIASKLMSFGANQQLISSQIMEKIKTPDEAQVPAAPAATGPQATEAPIASNPPVASVAPTMPATSVAPVISSASAELATPTASAPVMSTPLSENALDYIEIEPNLNQTLDGQPLESQPAQVPQSPEPQISPAPQPQEPQSVSHPASAPQSFESQPVPAPQVIESQSAPAYQAPINPAAAAASAVMKNNFIQSPGPNLPQPNYTNETPNYQAPVMPTPPLNFAQNLATPQPAPAPLTAQNLATPQPVSAPFATPNALDMSAAPTVPSPLNAPTSLTPQASFVASVSQEQPMQYSAPVQPAQPIQPAQPVQPVQSMQYPEPSAPVQPMQFTAPVSQVQPMSYIEPMQSNSVAAPLQPTQSIPLVPPAPVIFDAASMPNQPLTSNQAFINPAPTDLMPPVLPMPPEPPATPDVAPVSSVPVEPPLRTFASESPLISQPIDTSVPAPAPIAEPTAIFSPEEPTEPAPAKIDPTAFHIPGM